MQLQLGATEIGQGADTAFSQMAAETTGISLEKVYIVSTQDTDTAPFDTGAYASRQTYVTGMAVKKCAQQLKARILDYAALCWEAARQKRWTWLTITSWRRPREKSFLTWKPGSYRLLLSGAL